MEANKKKKMTLPLHTTVLYGSGMFSFGFQLTLTGYYLMIFLTDVLKFDTAVAATINTVTQWAKIFLMLLAGVVVDRFRLKGGLLRPWILVGSIGLFIFFPLSFLDTGLPTIPRIIVFLAFYFGMILSYNIGWTGIRSIVGLMSKNNADAMGLTLASQIGGSLASVVWGFISAPLLNFSLWAGTTNRYAGTAFVCGCIILMCGLLMQRVTKPYDNDLLLEANAAARGAKPKKETMTVKQMLRNLSGPMIPYFTSAIIQALQSGFYSTLLSYFTTYVLKNPGLVAITLSVSSVVSTLTSFIAMPVALKFGKKRVKQISTFASAFFFVLLYFFGRTAPMFLLLRCLLTFASGFGGMLGYTFLNDIADYKEMKGERPARAFIQSIGGTATRVGQAISVSVAAFSLAAIGYQSGVEVTAQMGQQITGLMCWPPAICCLLSGIAFFWYKVDENELDDYRAEKFAAQAAAAKTE